MEYFGQHVMIVSDEATMLEIDVISGRLYGLYDIRDVRKTKIGRSIFRALTPHEKDLLVLVIRNHNMYHGILYRVFKSLILRYRKSIYPKQGAPDISFAKTTFSQEALGETRIRQ